MRGTTSYVPTVSTRNPRAPKSTSDPFKPFSTNLSLPSGSHDMLSLDRSLSGSTTSLSSVKDSVTRSGYGSSGYGSGTYSSFTHGGSGSSVVELERLKSKNRRLEKEVCNCMCTLYSIHPCDMYIVHVLAYVYRYQYWSSS